MWKRDEGVRPTGAADPLAGQPAAAPAAEPLPSTPRPTGDLRRPTEREGVVNIGKSVIIKGELSGSEDLTIEGQVEGKIELRQNILTIGPNGKIKAEIFAKAVIVLGEVVGNITSTEKVDIRDNGSVDGDIVSPRVAIADGAHFRGSIDMQRTTGPRAAAEPKVEARPVPAPAAAVAAPRPPAALS